MDNLPPRAPCFVARLFGFAIEEFNVHRDVSSGRRPPSEFRLTADPVPVAADGGEVLRPKGPCWDHKKLIVVPDGTPEYS